MYIRPMMIRNCGKMNIHSMHRIVVSILLRPNLFFIKSAAAIIPKTAR